MKTLAILLFLLITLLSFWVTTQEHQNRIFKYVCHKVEKELFYTNQSVLDWEASCLRASQQVNNFCLGSDTECLIGQINQQLSKLDISHLYLSSPQEAREVFFHIAEDTGMRVRLIEDKFVVYEIIPDSPALRARLRLGDVVLGKNGFELRYEDEVQSAGRFTIQRGDTLSEVDLQGEVVQEDLRPQLIEVDAKNAFLKLASFEGDFQGQPLFEKSQWASMVSEIVRYPHLIIDLRGNVGGNFAAMLRAISPFFCSRQIIGSIGKINDIRRPALRTEVSIPFPDDLNPEVQLETLIKNPRIDLETYLGYGCYKGAVTMLVDSNTGSAAEIFAEALHHRPRTLILGHPTSGNVLVGKREEVPFLPPGHVLSIPIATYVTSQNETLEDRGVQPDQLIFYDLKEALRGEDSWLLRALKH